MEASPVIFLGPSLPICEARRTLAADYRPPLRAGDLDGLPGPGIVGVVDGILEPRFRLATAEVERALSRGLRLFGAASTGVLLAIQIRHPALTGLGRICEFLGCYPDHAEDLVAVLYSDESQRPFTIPLVHAVLTYLDLSCKACWDEPGVEEVIRTLRRLPLHDRSEEALLACLHDSLGPEVHRRAPLRLHDYKADDARLLLHRIASAC